MLNFPENTFTKSGIITEKFLQLNLNSFNECVHYVHQLPYGRNSIKGEFMLVLSEQRGTCGHKHALISALAKEQNIDVKLHLGMFLATSEFDPRIEGFLKPYHISEIPEAHCFASYNDIFFDITFPDKVTQIRRNDILELYEINPSQLDEYKLHKHKAFIKTWIAKHQIPYSLDEVWQIREAWIAYLSQSLD